MQYYFHYAAAALNKNEQMRLFKDTPIRYGKIARECTFPSAISVYQNNDIIIHSNKKFRSFFIIGGQYLQSEN